VNPLHIIMPLPAAPPQPHDAQQNKRRNARAKQTP